VSWRAAFLAGAALLCALAVGHALFLPRPSETRVAEPTKNAWVEALVTFLRQPKAATVIAFLLVFRAGDALLFAMTTPLLKDLGLDTDTRGLVSGIAGTTASIVGAILGGLLVARVSLRRALFPIAVLQCAAIPLYAALAFFRPGVPVILAAVVLEQLVAGVGAAAFSIFILRRSQGTYKASHFATATALTTLVVILSGSASGYIAAHVGFPAFFVVAFVAAWPGVLLARRVPTG
jgi:PAT family beta-lactamase induction signal transducer AmpG